MTTKFYIQEQLFKVYDEIYHKLDIDPTYDPTLFSKYLDNFRLINMNHKHNHILKPIICNDIMLCSKNIIKLDVLLYDLFHIDRILDIDDNIFIKFCFCLRSNIDYDIDLSNYLFKNPIYYQPNNILTKCPKKWTIGHKFIDYRYEMMKKINNNYTIDLKPSCPVRKILRGDILLKTTIEIEKFYDMDIVIKINDDIIFECDVEYLNFNNNIEQISENEYLLSLSTGDLCFYDKFDCCLSFNCEFDVELFLITQNQLIYDQIDQDIKLYTSIKKEIFKSDDVIDNKIKLNVKKLISEIILITEQAKELHCTLLLNGHKRCKYDYEFSNFCYLNTFYRSLPQNSISIMLFIDREEMPYQSSNLGHTSITSSDIRFNDIEIDKQIKVYYRYTILADMSQNNIKIQS